jgi:hypothetical protein
MNAIGHKIADLHKVVITRKVYVRKEVHRHKLAITFEAAILRQDINDEM